MIGILGAMSVEIQGLMASLEQAKEQTVGRMRFVSGVLHDRDVVLAECGIGKVNAAACAQAMIQLYHPSLVLNVGVGGSLSSELHYAEVAVARDLVQHDVDTTALGDEYGLVSTVNMIRFPCDERAVNLIAECVRAVGSRAVVGTIASGDQFVATRERKEFIVSHFDAICCEMEGGAIAQVCYLNGTPCAVIRAISDNADEGAREDYPQFTARAVRQTEALMRVLLPRL